MQGQQTSSSLDRLFEYLEKANPVLFLQKDGKVGYHTDDGKYPEHPVRVVNHDAYFAAHHVLSEIIRDAKSSPKYFREIRGLTLDQVSRVHEVIEKLPFEAIKTIQNGKIAISKDRRIRTGAEYRATQRLIRVNPWIFSFDYVGEKYSGIENERFGDIVIVHELAHALDDRIRSDFAKATGFKTVITEKTEWDQILEKWDAEHWDDSKFVTQYAQKNIWEFFAESFVYYVFAPEILNSKNKLVFDFFSKHFPYESLHEVEGGLSKAISMIGIGGASFEEPEIFRKVISEELGEVALQEYDSEIGSIQKSLEAWIENQKVAFHKHDGFPEHPVAVKNHEEYFSEQLQQPTAHATAEKTSFKNVLERNPSLSNVIEKLAEHGTPYIVGGSVRDLLLGHEPKDFDIEVYGLSVDKLQKVVTEDLGGKPDQVGKIFGVFKVGNIDISLPRSETKIGEKHGDFDVKPDPNLPPEKAARRRDFTINSMLLSPHTGELLDFFGGQKDLADKVIRHIDAETFIEDPLRVYRAAQFAARFGFQIAPETIELASTMDLSSLPPERLNEEFNKMFLRSEKPSVGLDALDKMKVLERYFPEIASMERTPQRDDWHAEGNVFVHTKMALDKAANIAKSFPEEKDRRIIMLSTLMHDSGKPSTTIQSKEGRPAQPGHEAAGIEPTKVFLSKLTNETDVVDDVLFLIENHLRPLEWYRDPPPDSAFRRAINKYGMRRLGLLAAVSEADSTGRLHKMPDGKIIEPQNKEVEWFRGRLKEISEQNPVDASGHLQQLIQGRDLIELGFSPGKQFGKIIQDVASKQEDGSLRNKEEAKKYVLDNYDVSVRKSSNNLSDLTEWLQKQQPPRPGLVPKSGDPQHPYRWIRPEAFQVATHTPGFSGTALLENIKKNGLKIDAAESGKRGKGTLELDRRLGRSPAIYTFSFDEWVRRNADVNVIYGVRLESAVFVILTPSIQENTEVQDYTLAHSAAAGDKKARNAWKNAKRKYGEDISHIVNFHSAEYASFADISPANLVFGDELLSKIPIHRMEGGERGFDTYNVFDIRKAIQNIARQRQINNLLKEQIAIHVWLPDEDIEDEANEALDLQKSYAFNKCMDGDEPPTTEILWAEGMAHAWFCDRHLAQFKKEHPGEVSSERKLKIGVASKHWKDGVPTKKDELALKKEDIPISTKAIIFNDEGKVLVLKDRWSQWWDLSGGHVDSNETIDDSLRREIFEETGLKIADAERLKDEKYQVRIGKDNHPVVFYHVKLEASDEPIKLSREHTDYAWISEEDLPNYNLGVFREVLENEFVERKEQLLQLQKQEPPRPGLIPATGNYLHPGRWILPQTASSVQHSEQQLTKLTIGTKEFLVEFATTPSQIVNGLSGREKLEPENGGLLFVFPDDAKRVFHTRGMKFPIDFIWIDSSHKVTGITRNAMPDSGKNYVSKGLVKYVLEANAGQTEDINIDDEMQVNLEKHLTDQTHWHPSDFETRHEATIEKQDSGGSIAGGGTVAVSSNPGIFTATFGESSGSEKRKKAVTNLLKEWIIEKQTQAKTGLIPKKVDIHLPSGKTIKGLRWVRPEEGQHLTPGKIRIPPAWTDVWVSPDKTREIQAFGKDSKGRAQYLYSKKHSRKAVVSKFNRLRLFQKAIPKIRARIEKGVNRHRQEAEILYLIDRTAFRIGSNVETLAKVKAYGTSTLLGQHVKLNGDQVSFDFIGKKGVRIKKTVKDRRLAEIIARRKKAEDKPLFTATDGDVRVFLHSFAPKFTIKDFRTYHGTEVALQQIQKMPAPENRAQFKKARKEVAEKVAQHLGNTWGVALHSYVNPVVFSVWTGPLAEKGIIIEKELLTLDDFLDTVHFVDEDVANPELQKWIENQQQQKQQKMPENSNWSQATTVMDPYFETLSDNEKDENLDKQLTNEKENQYAGMVAFGKQEKKKAEEEEYQPEKDTQSDNHQITALLSSEEPIIDAYTPEIYDYLDSQIAKSGFNIPGNLPRKAKTVGLQTEQLLYSTLKDNVDEFLSILTGTESEVEVIKKFQEFMSKWYQGNESLLDKAFHELFKTGIAAGVISAGVKTFTPQLAAQDINAIKLLQAGKYRIGERISIFADELVEQFASIIKQAYTPEGQFSLDWLTQEMKKVVPTERWKLERVARTEVGNISTLGRILAWSKDIERGRYNYIWRHANDNRVRKMKLIRASWNPLTFSEAAYLWTHNEQLIDGHWMNGNIQCRCTISRYPRDDEYTGNRFEGQPIFRRTLEIDFD